MQTSQVEVSPEWGRRSLLLITVYRYQGSRRRELSFSCRGWRPPLQTHFKGCVHAAMTAPPRTLPHKEQRWPLANGAVSVAQLLPASSKKKSISQKKLFSTPDCPRLTARSFCNAAVELVPRLWCQLGKDLGRNWYARVLEKSCGPVSMLRASRDVGDTETMEHRKQCLQRPPFCFPVLGHRENFSEGKGISSGYSSFEVACCTDTDLWLKHPKASYHWNIPSLSPALACCRTDTTNINKSSAFPTQDTEQCYPSCKLFPT